MLKTDGQNYSGTPEKRVLILHLSTYQNTKSNP